MKYVPGNRDLDTGITVDAWHPFNKFSEFDTHSLFGTMEVIGTNKFFTEVLKKRAFIIERSSISGMGKYGSKWLGDNFSKVEYLAYSVYGIMNMNIFGIPLAGADICGFEGDTTPELCARWTVAGAFYPFSRNHNFYYSIA